ncbi:MAG: polyprenol monophosphomannose synthase [Desulfobacterales bacterium]|jgi:dolichol-phosphate mannosyltransferase
MEPISFEAIPTQGKEKPVATPTKVDCAVDSHNKMPIACVILPTYNEIENVTQVIPAVFQQAAKISDSHDLHVLVVDDDSPDGTYAAVQKLQREYKNLHVIGGMKRGLGDAYKRGIKYALKHLSPDVIIQMDADGQHDPEKLPQFIALSNSGFSLVIGSRLAPGGETPDFSLWRKFLSHFGNWLIRSLGGVKKIHDCTSGFRCIKADVVKECDLTHLSTRGYSFQSSLLCEMMRHNATFIEVPILFKPRMHGISKLAFRDQLEFLLNIVKIRFGERGKR